MNDRNLNISCRNKCILLRILVAALWLSLIVGCRNRSLLSPEGTPVPLEDLETLHDYYQSIMLKRQNELDFRIALSQPTFENQEQVEILATLTNRSSELITVRKVSSLPIKEIDVDDYETSEILYYITIKGTEKTIGIVNLVDFVDPGFPTVDAFLSLPSGESYTEVVHLPPLETELAIGNYQLQIRYVNQEFGGLVQKVNQDDKFIDFAAWMGNILSNVIDLEITGR